MSARTPTGATEPRHLSSVHGGRERRPSELDAPALGPEDVAALAAAMRRVAERFNHRGTARDLGATQQEIARAALAAVPAAAHAGLTVLADDGRLVSAAPGGEIVARLDQAQAVLHEGPCFDAARWSPVPHGGDDDEPGADRGVAPSDDGALVRVPDMAVEAEPDGRWPRFGREALRLDVRSMISVPIVGSRDGVTVLNLYALRPGAFGGHAEIGARMFADQAAAALCGAFHSVQLAVALESRDVIGQAKGILMQRHRITADAAFGKLVEASQASNMKLADVARWLVHEVTTRPVDPA